MLTALRVELYKIITKPRSYIGLAAIAVIASLIQFAMWEDGRAYISMVTQSIEQTFNLEGKILNGNLVCYIILQMLIIQVPLLVTLVTGDLMSGESAAGTMRLLATKPISRFKILLSKYIAGAIYTATLLIFLAFMALGLGLLIFGDGDLIVLKSDELVIIQNADVLWRFFAAFGMAYLSLMLVASLSFMLSCFTNNSIGPIITTMAIMILFTIICTLEIPLFDKIKPFLFTTHMISWHLFFDNPILYDKVVNSGIIMLAHIAVFLSVSWFYFKQKDILV